MFLFLKLYLAHLIGDFVLQFDELYRLKLKSPWGHFFHALVHAALSLALLFPYLDAPFIWIFVFVTADIHLFQDALKYKLIQNRKYHFPIFTLDQILHLLFLATIALFPASRQSVPLPADGFLSSLYLDNRWTYVLIAWISATMAGSYTLHAFSVSYLGDHRKDRFISRLELIHGFFERTVVGALFFLASNPLVWLAAPAAGGVRLLSAKLRNRRDFLVSLIYAACVGILFRLLPLAVQ